jgi:hypothetical protein
MQEPETSGHLPDGEENVATGHKSSGARPVVSTDIWSGPSQTPNGQPLNVLPSGNPPGACPLAARYWTAPTMLKIGRYMATIMPPTTTPSRTIITGSISESRFSTAASTSSS